MSYIYSLSFILRLLIGLGLLVVVLAAYYGISFYLKLAISKELVQDAKAYELQSASSTTTSSAVSVLVLGDSTGVGVGATRPEDSIAGLLAQKVGATSVENYALSGAITADLTAEITQTKLKEYSYILVQIGANDIVRFHDPKTIATQLDEALALLPKAQKVVVIMAGNVGTAAIFPWFMRPFYTARTLAYHAAFSKVVMNQGFTYVNLYKPISEDLFAQKPDVYLAKDGFHPSSSGYALWFKDLIESL